MTNFQSWSYLTYHHLPKLITIFILEVFYSWLLDITFFDVFVFLWHWSYSVSPINHNSYQLLKFGMPWESFFDSSSFLFFSDFYWFTISIIIYVMMTPKFVSCPDFSTIKLYTAVYLPSLLGTPLNLKCFKHNVDFSSRTCSTHTHSSPSLDSNILVYPKNNNKTKPDSSLKHFIYIPQLICPKYWL